MVGKEIDTWSGNSNLTSNWKKRSRWNGVSREKRHAVLLCAPLAIPRLFAATLALYGVGIGWRTFFAISGSAFALYFGHLAFQSLPVVVMALCIGAACCFGNYYLA
jgi:hypothetical protein